MEHARPPPALSPEGSMDVNWRNWREQFLIFLKASGGINKPNNVKANLLMNLIGSLGQQVAENFDFNSPKDAEDMDILIEKFNDHFGSNATETRERYIFFSSARRSNETIDQYVNTLKARVKNCNFGDLTHSLIRDKIVLDVKSKKLRKSLLRVPHLSLDQTIDLWKKFEAAEKLIQLCMPKSVLDTINKQEHEASTGHSNSCIKNDALKCGRCGAHGKHKNTKECPAWGEKCKNCGMVNHLAISCTKPAIKKNHEAQN